MPEGFGFLGFDSLNFLRLCVLAVLALWFVHFLTRDYED